MGSHNKKDANRMLKLIFKEIWSIIDEYGVVELLGLTMVTQHGTKDVTVSNRQGE